MNIIHIGEINVCNLLNILILMLYHIGDRVRHLAKLNSYEKYDKTKDSIIFCIACGTLCDIADDTCCRCKCPLLK